MQNILTTTKILILILCSSFLVSCDDNDNDIPIEGTNSIINYLEKDSTFSIFTTAIDRAGLKGFLDGNSGTYTVLAPDNEAMETYLAEHDIASIENLPVEDVRRLVNYHILETLTPADNFVTSYTQTLATFPVNDSVDTKLSLFVKSTADSVTFNDQSKLVEKDIQVDNGILHKINHTLALPTLKTFMTADDNLKAFYQKITAAGIDTDFENLLSDPDQRTTIFVPNENAVDIYFDNAGSTLSNDQLNKLYRYHLLDTLQITSNFKTGYLKTKAREDYSGENYPLNLYVNVEAGSKLNTGKNIAIADLMTINGDIQVTDSVLTLPTVETFVKSDARFKTFKNQLSRDDQQSQNYFDLLSQANASSSTPLTVFAPDNEAFDDVVRELYPEENATLDSIGTDQMTDILNLHIHEQSAERADDFTDGPLSTLGGMLQIQTDDTITIKDPAGRTAKLIDTDFQADNGVVHHIDQVLLND